MQDAAKLDQENPLGVDGFEFVEFTGPEPEAMITRLELMGFTPTHVNPANGVVRLKQGGRIVTMASVSGITGNRGQVNYSAAKGGIIAASKALALELAKRRITVNCVAPGLIETDMVNEEVIAHAMPQIPLQRMGQADEVAALVNFLLSDDAAYITRQVISINGGMV